MQLGYVRGAPRQALPPIERIILDLTVEDARLFRRALQQIERKCFVGGLTSSEESNAFYRALQALEGGIF